MSQAGVLGRAQCRPKRVRSVLSEVLELGEFTDDADGLLDIRLNLVTFTLSELLPKDGDDLHLVPLGVVRNLAEERAMFHEEVSKRSSDTPPLPATHPARTRQQWAFSPHLSLVFLSSVREEG